MNATTVITDGYAKTTGKLMRKMVRTYKNDMLPYFHLTLNEIFDKIKSLPFRPDPPAEETLMRPLYTMTMSGYGGDCDDKCIALAAWLTLAGGRAWFPGMIPRRYDWRFVAARRPDMQSLHHVYLELYIENRWIPADPTYKFNSLGREREYYEEKVFI